MVLKHDVIIVGAGPAGLFAALELSKRSGLKILILEKGKDLDQRSSLVIGLGGAGAYSDGKLILSSQTGGRLAEYLGREATNTLIRYVDDTYCEFGAPPEIYGMGSEVAEIGHQATLAGLRLIPAPVRHMGTEICREVIKAIQDRLTPRVEFGLETAAVDVLPDGQCFTVMTDRRERLSSSYVVLAPGREGSNWLSDQARKLALTTYSNPVDVGLRVEVPYPVLARLTDSLYEAKLEYVSKSFEDRVRTFCMCPAGEVVAELLGGDDPVTTVNGQSYAKHQTGNTNFALLVSTSFTEPFHEPIAYGKYLARLANLLSGGVLLQRLGDLLAGRRSTRARIDRGLVIPTLASAVPGDVSFVLPYRQLSGILEMLTALDKLAPGVASAHTLLYGVEVKFYSYRPKLSSSLETEVAGLYAVGDGSGVSRGLIQASASGVACARDILMRIR